MWGKCEDVEKMWKDYLLLIGENVNSTNKKYDSWYFCDNEESANDLAELTKKGIKRGTTSLYFLYEIENEKLPKVNEYNVITDWCGKPKCIIKTKNVTILPFKDVDDEFAAIEGEGDKSLEYWRKVHIEFFSKELNRLNLKFTEDMLVVFEEFEVVYRDVESSS